MADKIEIGGLHHVTAVTGRASENVAFYTQGLGMRLVKKTVNQDDVSAYHLFYADAKGSPGTDLTFFDWPYAGPNRAGTGEVATSMLRVPGRTALDYWAERLSGMGVAHEGVEERGGRELVAFADPEGQRIALVSDPSGGGGEPWAHSPVPAEVGVRGLYGAALSVKSIPPTAAILETVLGFRKADEYEANGGKRVVVYESGRGGPGAEVHLEERPDLPPARTGIGGVHHVAFRAATPEEHAEWRARIARTGLGVTPVIDRFYFKSIYFREPGGVLFEIATDGPGFATDEDLDHLGEGLALPPFLEPRRREIEAGLQPIEPVETGVGR